MRCWPTTRHSETALANTTISNASHVRADTVGSNMEAPEDGAMSGRMVRRKFDRIVRCVGSVSRCS
jgi:hypothetical protein